MVDGAEWGRARRHLRYPAFPLRVEVEFQVAVGSAVAPQARYLAEVFLVGHSRVVQVRPLLA